MTSMASTLGSPGGGAGGGAGAGAAAFNPADEDAEFTQQGDEGDDDANRSYYEEEEVCMRLPAHVVRALLRLVR